MSSQQFANMQAINGEECMESQHILVHQLGDSWQATWLTPWRRKEQRFSLSNLHTTTSLLTDPRVTWKKPHPANVLHVSTSLKHS
jgi:hypothetical protein